MNTNVTSLLKKLLVLSLAVATVAPLCAMKDDGGGGGGKKGALYTFDEESDGDEESGDESESVSEEFYFPYTASPTPSPTPEEVYSEVRDPSLASSGGSDADDSGGEGGADEGAARGCGAEDAAAVAASVLRERRRATPAADAPAITAEEMIRAEAEERFRFFAEEALGAMNSWHVALFPCCGFQEEAIKTAKRARTQMKRWSAKLGLIGLSFNPPEAANEFALWVNKAELYNLYAKVSNAIGDSEIMRLIFI